MRSKISQLKKHTYDSIYEVPKIGTFIAIETIIEGTRGCGEGAGRGSSVLWVHSFCLGMMKKILEKDSGDGCATLWMCLMPPDCTLNA